MIFYNVKLDIFSRYVDRVQLSTGKIKGISYTSYKSLNSNPYTYKYYYTMKMSIHDSLKYILFSMGLLVIYLMIHVHHVFSFLFKLYSLLSAFGDFHNSSFFNLVLFYLFSYHTTMASLVALFHTLNFPHSAVSIACRSGFNISYQEER